MDRLKAFVESRRLERVIMALIIVNAITLGLETSPWAMQNFGEILYVVDRVILAFFVLEIALRLIVYRLSVLPRSPGTSSTSLVVGVALVRRPATCSVLRALRILRVLR